jgi:Zn-dependent peptidase ImmA (M78 family)
VLDVEGEARFLLRDFAGEAPGARALVKHHLEDDAIVVVRLLTSDGEKFRQDDRTRIAIRPKLSPLRLRWTLMHELAEWHLDTIGYREEDREQAADALAAALIAPSDVFQRAVRRHGRDLAKLAHLFGSTQTSIAMRLAEVRSVEAVAVVRAKYLRVRAPDGFVLPTERELRRIARGEPSPLERHELTDERGAALIAA